MTAATKDPERPVDEPLPADWWRSPQFRGRCWLCGHPVEPGQIVCGRCLEPEQIDELR